LEADVSAAITRIVVALLAGMLIGVEREKARAAARKATEDEEESELVGKEFPGLRTFSLIAVYAAVASYMFSSGYIDAIGFSILVAVFLVVVAVFSAYRLLVARVVGVTTSIVMMIDFVVGLLAGFGEVVVAASLAVLTTFILAIKIPVSRVVGRISYEELLWALELGIVLVVLGPVLLTSELTLYGVSVRGLYLFFALVLVASYIGYVVVRLKGGRGLTYLSFLGGFAHSEATLTGVLELLPPDERRRVGHHVAVLANTAMLVRDLLIAVLAGYMYHASLTAYAGLSVLAVAVVASSLIAIGSWARMLRVVAHIPPTAIGNPLRFTTALKTSAVYIVMSFASHVLSNVYGAAALGLVAFIGGLVSSSATILAVYSAAPPQTAYMLAAYAMAAGAVNKALYAYTATGDATVVGKVLILSALQALILITVLWGVQLLALTH
jgi:uncharacterized membrane protein (DUF4010 family)